MNNAKSKLVIGALLAMFLLAGTAWAEPRGARGPDVRAQGRHQALHHHDTRPVAYQHHGHFSRPFHRGPRFHHFHRHRAFALGHPGYRHYRPHHSRPVYDGYRLHLSVFDPYFMFGFSTGGR